MVARRRNPSDHRVTFVRLTEDGRKHIVNYKKEKMNFVSQMLKDFRKEEVEILNDMLLRLQNNISQY